MPGDAFKKVTSGEKFKPSARAWNQLMDLARGVDTTAEAGSPSFGRDADLVKIQNNTNTNLNQFAIVGLGTPLITPAQNEGEFRRQITFHGDTPLSNTHQGKFAILQQPLAINAIGWGLVAGVTPVVMNTVNTNAPTFAEVVNGNTGVLQAGTSGSAQILYIENTNTNSNLAVVRLSVPQAASSFSGCRVTNSGTQSVNSGAGGLASVNFDSEDYDTDGYHSTVANNDQLIIPATGYYRFGAYINWTFNSVGTRIAQIRDSASGILAGTNNPSLSPGGIGTSQSVSGEAHFVAGDYIRVVIYQDSGAALSTLSGGYYPSFWIQKIG